MQSVSQAKPTPRDFEKTDKKSAEACKLVPTLQSKFKGYKIKSPLVSMENKAGNSPKVPFSPRTSSDISIRCMPPIKYDGAEPKMVLSPTVNLNPPPDFKKELRELVCLPDSCYTRSFPPVNTSDSLYCNHDKKEKAEKTVTAMLTHYRLFENHEFAKYLEKSIPGLQIDFFKPGSTTISPMFLFDTVSQFVFRDDPELQNVSIFGEHGYSLSYHDADILEVNKPETILDIEKINVKYTHNNRPVIQQQATRGCSYAVVAMLLHQHQRTFSVELLRTTNLRDKDFIIKSLSSAGLTALISSLQTLEDLTEATGRYGSAIVTVCSAGGWHSVIVDEVTVNFVLIRDPYHGWEVKIRREAFLKSWQKDTIQVTEPSPTSIRSQVF